MTVPVPVAVPAGVPVGVPTGGFRPGSTNSREIAGRWRALEAMDLQLARQAHARRFVRLVGVPPEDPYVARCWLPIAGPTAVALVRRVSELARGIGEPPVAVPCRELARMLGLRASEAPTRNNPIGHALLRVQRYGLGGCHLAEGRVVVYDRVPLVPRRLFARLPAWCWEQHVTHVDVVNDHLAQAGFLHPGAAAPAGEVARSPVLDRYVRDGTPPDAPPQPTAARPERRIAATPTTRLDMLARTGTPPPAASL